MHLPVNIQKHQLGASGAKRQGRPSFPNPSGGMSSKRTGAVVDGALIECGTAAPHAHGAVVPRRVVLLAHVVIGYLRDACGPSAREPAEPMSLRCFGVCMRARRAR